MIEEFQRTNPLARGDESIKPLEVYAEHAEIRKQIYDEIRKLYNIFHGSHLTILERFTECLTPLKHMNDPGRLPVYRTKPISPCPDRKCCVWAIVSCLVQAYWEYELEDGDEKIEKYPVLLLLKRLREINEHYPEMRVAGAENRGYWLEL